MISLAITTIEFPVYTSPAQLGKEVPGEKLKWPSRGRKPRGLATEPVPFLLRAIQHAGQGTAEGRDPGSFTTVFRPQHRADAQYVFAELTGGAFQAQCEGLGQGGAASGGRRWVRGTLKPHSKVSLARSFLAKAS